MLSRLFKAYHNVTAGQSLAVTTLWQIIYLYFHSFCNYIVSLYPSPSQVLTISVIVCSGFACRLCTKKTNVEGP